MHNRGRTSAPRWRIAGQSTTGTPSRGRAGVRIPRWVFGGERMLAHVHSSHNGSSLL